VRMRRKKLLNRARTPPVDHSQATHCFAFGAAVG